MEQGYRKDFEKLHGACYIRSARARKKLLDMLMFGMSTKKMMQPIFQDRKLEIHKDFVIAKEYYAPRLDKKLKIAMEISVGSLNL